MAILAFKQFVTELASEDVGLTPAERRVMSARFWFVVHDERL
jgi:hypothetical protein